MISFMPIMPVAAVTVSGAPGQVEINKTAVVSGNREYTVALTVKGNGLTTAKPADIVLVLDVSLSMNDRLSGTKTRLQVLKEAATTFVSTVLAGGDNRVAVVTYSTDVYGSGNWNDGRVNQAFSNSASTINTTINGLNAVSYTNMEAGYYHADAALDGARAGVDKIVIFMTDGVPNRYYSDTGATQGSGSDFSATAANQAIGAAEALKASHSGAKIFTIGLVNDDPIGQIASVLNPPSPHNYPEAYYQVTTASGLSGIYAYLSKTITQIADDAVVTDVIQHGFSYIPGSLVVPAGTSADVTGTPATAEVVTWNIGVISEGTLTLSFRVRAEDPVYGEAFTNASADLSFVPVPENTFYSPGTVELIFPRPDVPVPPIAVDDAYSVSSGDTLVVPAPGVLVNDVSADQRADGGWTSTPISGSVMVVTPPANGSLTQHPDGSLSYTPNPGFNGIDTYIYKISTLLTYTDGTTTTLEDTATVTITVSTNYWIKVHKTDNADGSNLAGVVFDLYDSAKSTVLETLPATDATGMAQTAVTYTSGTYYLKEASAPNGYVLDPAFHAVNIVSGNGTVTIEVGNERVKYPIGVNKIDNSSEAPLAGVIFELYSDAAGTALLETLLPTDQAGYAQTAGTYAPGTYYLKEKSTIEGYLLDTSLRPVVVAIGQEGVATLTVGNIAIGRVDIPVTKTWSDNENRLNLRPESITVHLWRKTADTAAVEVGSHALTGLGWTYTFSNQLATDEAGVPYIYSITEDVVTHYSTAINGFTITNTLSIDNNKPAISISKQVANLTRGLPVSDLAELYVGETAQYTVIITNSGNTALLDVILTDSNALVGGSVRNVTAATNLTWVSGTGGIATMNLGALAAGQSITLTYNYLTVAADLAREPITNTATVSGRLAPTLDYPNGTTVSDDDGAVIAINALPLAGLSFSKKVQNVTRGGALNDLAAGYAGDVFRYTLTISNNGAVNLSNVIITDDKATVGSTIRNVTAATNLTWTSGTGGIATINIGTLAAGATLVLTYDYTSDSDDNGDVIVNTAVAKGTVIIGQFDPQVITAQGDASISVDQIPLTGETNTSFLIGLAMLLGASALLIFRRRRNDRDAINT